MPEILIPKRRIIALDADGVLLDYNKAAANAWHAAFGVFPSVLDAKAYHFRNVYAMDLTDESVKAQYKAEFSKKAWRTMPALPGAIEGCQMLHEMGYELHVVSAMPEDYAQARRDNLRDLGMPIASVTATGAREDASNPKLQTLLRLQPIAFVDDLLLNFEGVHHAMHCALLHWDSVDNPNESHHHALKASSHASMVEFAQYWAEYGPCCEGGRNPARQGDGEHKHPFALECPTFA